MIYINEFCNISQFYFSREKLRLSRNKYEVLASHADEMFPTRYSLDKLAKEMKIPLTTFLNGKKSNFSENISKTLTRHLEAEKYVPDDNDTSFKVRFTAGFDG